VIIFVGLGKIPADHSSKHKSLNWEKELSGTRLG